MIRIAIDLRLTLCVSLFYVIDTGSTGSQGRTWGLSGVCLPFTLTVTLKLPGSGCADLPPA